MFAITQSESREKDQKEKQQVWTRLMGVGKKTKRETKETFRLFWMTFANLLFPNYFFGVRNMADAQGGAQQQHLLTN